MGQRTALVQLGQAENIVDQRHQPVRLLMDTVQEPRLILRLHQTVFQQFRAADNGLQGRFQFVRHVGGELPPHPLGFRLLRHIKGQQNRTQHLAVGFDTAEIKLVFPASPLCPQLTVPGLGGVMDGGGQVRMAIHCQEILSYAGTVRMKQCLGRRIDAEDAPAVVQQHQTFPHTAGDLFKFVLPLPEVSGPMADLLLLGVDPPQQRRQLLIGVVVQRVLQIQPVQRLHHPSGRPARQECGKSHRQQRHHDDGVEHPKNQHPYRFLTAGNAEHRAVRQAHRLIEHLFRQRLGIAGAAAAAAGERLPDLLPLAMIFHGLRIRSGVIQHCAVRCHPGQPLRRVPDAGQIVRAVRFHRRRSQCQFCLKLLFPHRAEIGVKAAGDHQQRCQQHRQ